MFELTGRVALVTGAGRGIGIGIAAALARQGALVAVNDLRQDRAQRSVDAINAENGTAITSVFDLRPGAIVRDLDLLRPIYAQTAAYGHFGRTDVELPWEQLNKVDELKAAV